MQISVNARNYCAEVTVKGDNYSFTVEATCAKERVALSRALISAAYDVLNMYPVTESETIQEVKSKLLDCHEELCEIINKVRIIN
jgi:hypothetical protein